MDFEQFGLSEPILRAVRGAGYTCPTPIQTKAIAPALDGRDILGCAQTGTGKTAAFCLPLLHLVHASSQSEPALRALILTPTRELAAQIGQSIATYGSNLDLWHTVIFGGVDDKRQINELKEGVDIVVATPGRLLDLLNRGALSLSSIEYFVVDEADRMLDMGFLPDVQRIVKRLPKQRQTMFFSATMPPAIRKLAATLLTDPVQISVDPVSSTADRIEQSVYFVEKKQKRRLLVEVLQRATGERTLVFSRTKHGANRIAKDLQQRGIAAAAIHGNKSQGARTRALEQFRSGELPVLVATDIAARGIDVADVVRVVNFDLPNVPETYVHRIGRTARAGRAGLAISFCDTEERAYLRDIERLIRKNLICLGTPAEVVDSADSDPQPGARVEPGPRVDSGRRSGAAGRAAVGRRTGRNKGRRPARRADSLASASHN